MRKFVSILCVAFILAAPTVSSAEPVLQLNLAAQPLADSLRALAAASNTNIAFDPQLVKGLKAPAVSGPVTTRQALEKLLQGTRLQARFVDEKTVSVVMVEAAGTPVGKSTAARSAQIRLARVDTVVPVDEMQDAAAESINEEDEKGIPEVLVKGRKSLNMDIRRTEDDIQPYVVFEQEEIRNSMATSLEEFLTLHLPMNTSTANAGLMPTNTFGDRSGIDLRGLGEDETLILVNGRRRPGFSFGASAPGQPNINAIPLASIKRIEVLPATAGGIYGGGSTGGVINIILKDDFQGIEVNAKYNNTFDTDHANLTLSLNSGFTLENGRTQVTLSAGYSDTNSMLEGDRDFVERGRSLMLRNNPDAVYGGTSPPLGRTANIRSSNGQPLVLKDGMRSLGSPITYVPYGYAGPASDNGEAFIANAGKFNLGVPEGLLGRQAMLRAAPRRRSVSLSVRRGLGERVELFADGMYNESKSYLAIGGLTTLSYTLQPTAPNNPFTQAIRVSFSAPDLPRGTERLSTNSTLTFGAGAILRLPHNWSAQAHIDIGRDERDYVTTGISVISTFNTALSNGTLDILRDTLAHPLDYTPYLFTGGPTEYPLNPYATSFRSYSLRAAGPLLNLPAGPLKLSTALEYRETEMDEYLIALVDASANTRYRYSHPRPRKPAASTRNSRRRCSRRGTGLPACRALMCRPATGAIARAPEPSRAAQPV